jgi:hypothetical protein
VQWDGVRLGITGQEAAKLLLDTDPRIVVANASGMRPAAMASSVSIVPYMMMPGEDKIVADKLYAVLSKPPKFDNPPAPQNQNASIAGQWDVKLDFGRGSASHTLMLEQDGTKLAGTHRGEFSAGDLAGTVAGNTVRFRSSLPTLGSRVSFDFNGTLDAEKLSGTVNLGEYGQTNWTAHRHQYQTGGRRG